MQKNYAVLITKHQSPKGVSIFFYSYWLSFYRSVTVPLSKKAATRKVLKIKEFADAILFLHYQGMF